jgi:hypothetical protein
MKNCIRRLSLRSGYLALLLVALLGSTAHAVDRNAFTFVRYDLDARVMPAEKALAVRGRLTLRNDSAVPQRSVVLQVSSSLMWDSIESGGEDLEWVSNPYNTDLDHTGAVSEAIARLPAPVPPKGTVELEVVYGGALVANANRLTRLGVPVAVAARTEWDTIGGSFTGVRGLGHVCWYPVSLEAASLSEGAAVFRALGEWKQRHAASTMKLALSVESDQIIVGNGRPRGQRARLERDGPVREREFEFSSLGQTVPTFAVADYTLLDRPALNIFYLPGQEARAQEFALTAEKLQPFLTDWLGPLKEKASIIELPAGAVPFDSGSIFFSPLGVGREAMEVTVAHALAHAAVHSDRPWISEGLAYFAQALVIERQQGRRQALAFLQLSQPALAAAEAQAVGKPGANGADTSAADPQPLIRTGDELYFRSKAMFVWWMLRDMLGDEPLGRALRAYRAAEDRDAAYMQRLLEAQSGKKLEWFFDDWVYRDRGLPEFRVESAYLRQMLPTNYTVTVTVENRGNAAAEVPVMAPLEGRDFQERLLVPAHGRAVARITTPSAPAEVVVNDGSVPEADIGNNRFSLPKQAEPAKP